MAVRVLVVEDDERVRLAVVRLLTQDGMNVASVDTTSAALADLEQGTATWDVLVLGVDLAGTNGIEVLRRSQEVGSLTSIVMLSEDSTAATATACMRAGAFHYLTKPYKNVELSATIASAARYSMLRHAFARAQQILGEPERPPLVGGSRAIRQLRATIRRLAESDVSVLIQGESGSGKELVARELHEHGARRGQRFIAINCGAIPESLIDSELFGHVRGAFTGASTDRAGVFVDADRGTLLLDEIGDMPMAVQARLLRVLQEGEIRPIGGNTSRKVNVRVIAATHVKLAEAVARNAFREDLFYRLNVVTIEVPPLRDRIDDLPLLAAHLLRKHGGAAPRTLGPDALQSLVEYPWPGNVRELENALLHALALSDGNVIGVGALPLIIGARLQVPIAVAHLDFDDLPFLEAKRQSSAALERRYLLRVINKAKGSVSEAARLAGLDRTNFRRLLQRNAIDPADFK